MSSIATHIIDLTGGTLHTVDTLLAAAVPAGSFLVSALDTQLGSNVWQTHPTGAAMVTAINAAIGSTVWQGGGSGTPAWGTIVGTLADQADLQAALDGKAASSHTHTLSQITDVTVTSTMVSIPKGIRPGLYDDLGTPPVGTIFEGANDGHLFWAHRDGSVHMLCDSGGYGGGATDWGDITGTLGFQTDLQDALDGKQAASLVLNSIVSNVEDAIVPSLLRLDIDDSVTRIPCPAYAQSLLATASANAAQTVLQLVPTVNVQTQNANLQAISGLTSAADKGIYFTGDGTAATFTVTTAARALMDDTSGADMRITIGVVIGVNVQAYSSRLATFVTVLNTPLANAAQAAVVGTAGGSYTATEQGVINDLVTLVNRLRTELIAARIILGSA